MNTTGLASALEGQLESQGIVPVNPVSGGDFLCGCEKRKRDTQCIYGGEDLLVSM